jgi:hypothetical protein
MDISAMTKNVKFSIEAKHPLCAKLLAKAGLLRSDSELVNVIRTRNTMRVNSSPHDDSCGRVNYQYFKRDHYQEGLNEVEDSIFSGEKFFEIAFESAFALEVRDLLELDAEEYHNWKVSYKVVKRDYAYETVAEFSVVFFNSKEDREAVISESLSYPYNDGYVKD